MNRTPLFLTALLAFGASAMAQTPAATPPAAPTAAPVTYKLDPSKGFLYVQVYKDPDTLASGLSHDHVIRSTGYTGTVTWDPTNPGACQVEINVPVKSLQPDADDMRKKVGYDTVLDEGQRKEVMEHIVSDTQLDASKFPNITFKSTKCEGTGASAKVTGNFTMHGVTKSITVPMNISADGTKFSAKGNFKVLQTDYGFQPFSALLGQLKNKNEMSFTIDVLGTKG